MSIVITSTGKGAAISESENDANLSSMCGINEAQVGDYTVVAADQNRTIEVSKGTAVAITLDEIATIIAAIDTDDFKVTILNIGVGAATITPDAADTINNGDATIVLATDEFVTLQTDSTKLIWNIINKDIDTATITGTETLTNKTLTSPLINGVAGYGLVMIPVPENLFSLSTGDESNWVSSSTSASTTLPSAGAKIAIVNFSVDATTLVTGQITFSIRKTGAVVNTVPTRVAAQGHVGNAYVSGQATVELDSNSDFDVNFGMSNTSGLSATGQVYLAGYYV